MDQIAGQLDAIRADMRRAATLAVRSALPVRLIAVTKTVSSQLITSALEAGQRDFGENRVQEAKAKWPALRSLWPDLRLHLIGPLQSNKTADAVALFDAIHTIDRDRIAASIAEEMARQGRRPLLLVQVNIGNEPQKAGIAPEDAVAFVRRCREVHGLVIAGLMCIPPAGLPPAPFFALTAKLARQAGVRELSMGMSADFEMAIAFGATMVRIGTAIFGERRPAADGEPSGQDATPQG